MKILMYLMIFIFSAGLLSCNSDTVQTSVKESINLDTIPEIKDSIEIIMGTYLGNEKRNFYGNFLDTGLSVKWKFYLGEGKTVVSKDGPTIWKGAGWTGQPLMVKEKDSVFVIQGSYDHGLRKINAKTGKLNWTYKFDDVIKGTGTLARNKISDLPDESLLILQGSRRGLFNNLNSKDVFSFRAVSFFSGKEVWRMNIKKGLSYSRDVDASSLVINDTAYIGLENGYFSVFKPFETDTLNVDSLTFCSPRIINEHLLYDTSDTKLHGGNLVTEASPVRLRNRVYISSGSGHIYGYNMSTDSLEWDFFIGADLNGSPVVTTDSCLLIPVEKQYIKGKGGVLKLNPLNVPDSAVMWYFPTGNRNYADWQGGVIGSPCVNGYYLIPGGKELCAFAGIDGYLYVVEHQSITDSLVLGFDGIKKYYSPKLVYKFKCGPSISTPVMTSDKLLIAGYHGINLFEYNQDQKFKLINHRSGNFESTPAVHDGEVFLASRDGFLYCFGSDIPKTSQKDTVNNQQIETVELKKHQVKSVDSSLKKIATTVNQEKVVIQQSIKETPSKSKPESISSFHKFHLIAGVYKEQENVDKNVKILKSKSVDVLVIPSSSLLNFLSVYSSDSFDDINSKIKDLSKKTGVELWVRKSK